MICLGFSADPPSSPEYSSGSFFFFIRVSDSSGFARPLPFQQTMTYDDVCIIVGKEPVEKKRIFDAILHSDRSLWSSVDLSRNLLTVTGREIESRFECTPRTKLTTCVCYSHIIKPGGGRLKYTSWANTFDVRISWRRVNEVNKETRLYPQRYVLRSTKHRVRVLGRGACGIFQVPDLMGVRGFVLPDGRFLRLSRSHSVPQIHAQGDTCHKLTGASGQHTRACEFRWTIKQFNTHLSVVAGSDG